MISNRTRALDEGRHAYKIGADIDKANPYAPGVDDHENFREGYLAAKDGESKEVIQEREPAPPVKNAGDIVSEHPATNVESGSPFDTSSGEPFKAVDTNSASTFTNS